jgi:hypothetical protein
MTGTHRANGGYARAEKLSTARRSEIGRIAANARWGKSANDLPIDTSVVEAWNSGILSQKQIGRKFRITENRVAYLVRAARLAGMKVRAARDRVPHEAVVTRAEFEALERRIAALERGKRG